MRWLKTCFKVVKITLVYHTITDKGPKGRKHPFAHRLLQPFIWTIHEHQANKRHRQNWLRMNSVLFKVVCKWKVVVVT